MKTKKGITLLSLTILLTASHATAQAPFLAGGNFSLGFPQNEFKENVKNIGIGASGFFAYHFPQSPLLVGASVTLLVYGSETREEPFSTTIPDVHVDVTSTNSIIMGHAFFRIQPRLKRIIPYLDGLFGFNYLGTRTSIENESTGEEIASSTNFEDMTFSYGIGGGLMIRVYNPTQKQIDKEGLRGVLIDLGIRYLKSGEAEYLKKGSIRRENGTITYDIIHSTTDLIIGQIGVAFSF